MRWWLLWWFVAVQARSESAQVKCCINSIFTSSVASKVTKPILFEHSQDHLPRETAMMFHDVRNKVRVPIYEREVVQFAACTRSRGYALAVAVVFESIDNLFDVGNIFL